MRWTPRNLLRSCALLGLLPAAAYTARADAQPIAIDGEFNDWAQGGEIITEPFGDAGRGIIDLGGMSLANDERYLFVHISAAEPFDLSENNDLRLYIDTDVNAETGLAAADLGAELVWRFGERRGFVYTGDFPASVQHPDIEFRALPTVTTAEYEIAIARAPTGAAFTLGPVVRLRLETGSDRVPDAGEPSILYVFDETPVDPPAAIPLPQHPNAALRIATWNVLHDSPWQPSRRCGFRRELQAVRPDVISFQEIYDHTAEQTRAMVASWLPLPGGETWHVAAHADNKTVSRFPVLAQWSLDGNLAVLLDTRAALGTPLLIVNAHLPCCARDADRQAEVDRIIAFLRDARLPAGVLANRPGTGIVIVGDLNLVGDAQQLDTLVTGEIINHAAAGPSAAPDWDNSPLTSITPRQTERRMGYTWRSDTSDFWPGHLDFVIYTDSVIQPLRRFVLWTPGMSPAQRNAASLQADDSTVSDHLLFVADFAPTPRPAGDFDFDGCVDYRDLGFLLAGFLLDARGDLNGDAITNIDDVQALLDNYLQGCGDTGR